MSRELAQTSYDRRACGAGIVHLGFGAFHRAHLAEYVDDYMERSGDLRWGICAVNLKAGDSAGFGEISQDFSGYPLKTLSPEGDAGFRLVRPHVEFRDWILDPAGAEEAISLESVHVISLTVTESGYCMNPDRSLNLLDPVIRDEKGGGPRRSVYAYLAAGLRMRSRKGDLPVTLLCCDNIRSNGDMLRDNLLAYARHLGDPGLADWIGSNASFPNSMVDRITPRATAGLREETLRLFGERGSFPVHSESFRQWTLEGRFKGPFPDLSLAGVEVVDDVTPYEEAKIRILNGGHTALAYFGALEGYACFDELMRDARYLGHFREFETQEVLPSLPEPLPFDPVAYLGSVERRFCNRGIADSVERICADGYAKFPIFIMPSVMGSLHRGHLPERAIASAASWFQFARLHAAGRLPVNYLEPGMDRLRPLLESPDRFARAPELWGEAAELPEFARLLKSKISEMEAKWPA